MLSQLFPDPLHLRIAQATVSLVLVVLTLFLAHRSKISIASEGLLSSLRGLVQIVAIGTLLLFVFRGPPVLGPFVLLGMVLVGASIASKRAAPFPRAYSIAFWSILAGASAVIASMTWLGVVSAQPTSLIPIGSMLIANAMITTALTLERLRSEIDSNRGYIESALALGANAQDAAAPYIQAAVKASLIPRLDSMSSLGIVWIPGLMTGMLLAGTNPVQASLYQFVIVALILASGIVSTLCCALLCRSQLFTEAEQLRRLPPKKNNKPS